MAASDHPILDALIQAFNAVRETLLPSKGKKFTIRWHSSLPSVYESSVKALGGKPDEETAEALTEIAGSYLDALESRTVAQVQHLLHGDAMSEKIGSEVTLEEKIPEVLDKATTEIHTIVNTEVQRARAVGSLEGINQVAASVGDNDPTVFFVIVRDGKACETCTTLHMMPDGVTPRVWKLSECSTDYHKKGENFPSMWGEHPHCRCSSTYLPPGFGFTSGGKVTWVGKGYDEYKVQRGLE